MSRHLNEGGSQDRQTRSQLHHQKGPVKLIQRVKIQKKPTEALCNYQFHPKPSPSRDEPPAHDSKGATALLPGQSLCTKPLPRDKTGSPGPHPRDIKLEISQMYL